MDSPDGSTVPKRLDLTARSLDLTATVLKSSSTIGEVASAIVAWRAREGIDEAQLSYTLTLAKNITKPNKNGDEMRRSLRKKADHVAGLGMILPGAIGRMILADESLCWLASTHAVLFKYHDLQYSTDVLSELSLYRKLDATDREHALHGAHLARIRPVIERATESIAIHNTNLGDSVSDLPPELASLPRHLLTPPYFSRLVKVILANAGYDLVVWAQHAATDLLDWLYNHWPGALEVVYVAQVVYRTQLGDENRLLKFIIDEQCTHEGTCDDIDHTGRITVSVLTAASQWMATEPLCEAYTGGITRHDPGYRVELYDVDVKGSASMRLNARSLSSIRITAQDVIRALMHTHFEPLPIWQLALGLRICPASRGQEFRWWASRSPGLLQPNYGGKTSAHTTLRGIAVEDLQGPYMQEAETGRTVSESLQQYDISSLLQDYPEVLDVVKQGGEQCACGCYDSTGDELVPEIDFEDDGCLRTTAVKQLILLIGHAIADTAGIRDISNLKGDLGRCSLINATMQLLGELARRKEITWRRYFKLVASAVTGTTYDMVDNIAADPYGEELVGWVNGSMTVLPKWFEIEHALTTRHSWGVRVLLGKPTSLIAEHAVLQTQITSRHSSPLTMDSLIVDPECHWPKSDVNAQVSSSVIASNVALSRLLTLVSTPTSVRVINPADVYNASLHALRPHCQHLEKAVEACVRSFDDVLRGWDGLAGPESSLCEVFFSGGDSLKANIASGLAGGSAVFHTEQCCLHCALQEARQRGCRCISSITRNSRQFQLAIGH